MLKSEEDLLHILAISMQKANAASSAEFLSLSQFDIKKPKSYKQAINRPHVQQWAPAIQRQLDQLEKNETWTLVAKNDVEQGHKPLFGKWVLRVKRDVNGAIAKFKARWVVQGYLQ